MSALRVLESPESNGSPPLDLGSLRWEHEVRDSVGAGAPLGVVAALGGAGLLLAGGGFAAFLALGIAIEPPPPEVLILVVLLALFSGLAVPALGLVSIAGGVWLVRSAPSVDRALQVHDGGVVFRCGDEPVEVPWAQVRFFRGPTHKHVYGVRVELPLRSFEVGHGALRHEVRALPQLAARGQAIEDEVFRAALPAAREALERGEVLRFDAARVSAEGLAGFGLRREMIPWSQLTSLAPGGRRANLVARVGRTRALGPVIHRVPNVKVLLALVERQRAAVAR